MSDKISSVCIVGGGIGGSSASYFLRDKLGDDCEIVLFEKNDALGGRIQHTTVAGHDIELGAKWFQETHHGHLLEYAKEFDLELESRIDEFQPVGVWTGDRMITLERSIAGLARLLVRYGLDVFRLNSVSDGINESIDDLSRSVTAGKGYETTGELAESVGLDPLLEQNGPEYLSQQGIDKSVINELVTGIAGVMTGSSLENYHALVTVASISILTSAQDLLSIKGGNQKLCERFVDEADAKLRTGECIETVISRDEGVQVSTDEISETFDAVILAVPLEQSGIEVRDGNGTVSTPERQYNESEIAVIDGTIDSSAFGGQSPPPFVLCGHDRDLSFTTFWRVDNELYELIAPEISERILDELFESWRIEAHKHWNPWPLLTPPVRPVDFEISPNVYYVNAIESCFSTMAMSSIGAQNVVNLLSDSHDRGISDPEEVHDV